MTTILGGAEWLEVMASYQIDVLLVEYIVANFAKMDGETIDKYFTIADEDACPEEIRDMGGILEMIEDLKAETGLDELDQMVLKFLSKIVELVGDNNLTPAIVRTAATEVGIH